MSKRQGKVSLRDEPIGAKVTDWTISKDPLARTIDILRLEGAYWTIAATFGDLDIIRAEPCAALDLDLSLLWD